MLKRWPVNAAPRRCRERRLRALGLPRARPRDENAQGASAEPASAPNRAHFPILRPLTSFLHAFTGIGMIPHKEPVDGFFDIAPYVFEK